MWRRANASFQNVAEYVISNKVTEKTAFWKISECVCNRASLPAVLTLDFIQGKYETEPGVAL